MPAKSVEKLIIREEEYHIPLFLYREYRTNARISIGKDAVHLRIPLLGFPGSEEKHLQWAKTWVRSQLANKPALGHRFRFREYAHGMPVMTSLKTYRLDIRNEDRITVGSSVKDDRVVLKLPPPPKGGFTTDKIQRAIAKAVAADQQDWFEYRVDQWNDRFFQEQIESVRLNYVRSKWGSCSADRKLVFSSRLLKAPLEGMDYVIIHELAHLKELNHSRKFWSWVEKAMPDYKKWDKKLRHHGHEYDF